MEKDKRFTPLAAKRWAELGGKVQTRLLNNVWCVSCGGNTTIVRFTGRSEMGDVILQGYCIKCNSPVARVIEGG